MADHEDWILKKEILNDLMFGLFVLISNLEHLVTLMKIEI